MLTAVALDAEDERVLVERFLETRSEEAFRSLYRRHAGRLYAIACRMLGGADRGADDAIQETWLRAVRGLGAFRRESALSTWLCGILLNRCREVLRERSRTRAEELDTIPEPPAPVRPGGPEAIDLSRAVESLADGYREVLVLHDVEGYTHEEIARLLEIEPGTSKSQLSKAREALRRVLRSSTKVNDHD
jgi:RNA polymerase sigma-70 factor (ECF subfamily)